MRNAGRTTILFALIAAAVASTACGSATGPSDAAERNDANRRRFRALVGGSYTQEFQRSCFCIGPAVARVRLEVRNFAIQSVVTADDAVAVPPEDWGFYLTVDQLFDEIDTAIREGAETVEVEYDPALGYPASAFIDNRQIVADDELWYTVANVRPLP